MKLSDLICIDEKIDLDEYIKFRELVESNMEYPEWLGDFTKEDLINMLDSGSKIWMYYFHNEPVCSMMLIPSTEKDLKKFELDLNYLVVADYGPMMVEKRFIGNKLQLQMLKELDKYCLSRGYKFAVGTIHPDNIYSINNLLKNGFRFNNKKEFKRGIRNIYIKDLTENIDKNCK